MFTPPPSPRPTPIKETDLFENYQVGHDDMKPKSPSSPVEEKRNCGRRMRWAVLLVPLVLILITASTRYATYDVAADLLSEPPPSTNWLQPVFKHRWRPHKRSPEPQTASPTTAGINFPTSPSASSPTSSLATATATSKSLPTVPTSPPVLPSPFPQPFDTSLGSNFSSVGCQNFFLNMTSTVPFRECRPFSLLLLSSAAFIQAQQNITALNDIVWGTCNTDPGNDQCTANMSWFASALQSACQKDLSDLNTNAVNTLRALQAYSLMLDTGCVVDPTTNSYCYVSAAVNSNPSDLYFYQLPLGTNLANKTTISCSACTKTLMSLYDSALTGSAASSLTGLQKTYGNSAALADAQCGDGYAQQLNTGRAIGLHVGMRGVLGAAAVVLAGWSIFP